MKKELKIIQPAKATEMAVHMSQNLVKAGFPSPAEDYSDIKLDLNKELIKNPSATFFARVSGESMTGDGIDNGDLIIIDRSVTPADGSLAVCYLDGEFTLKRVTIEADAITLIPSNFKYKPIKVTAENEFLIWGIVKYVIKKV